MAKKRARTLKKTKRPAKARRAKKPARMTRKPAARISKKITRKTRAPKTRQAPEAAMELPRKMPVGTVTHFYTDISVCVIELTDKLRVGEWISIEGATTNLRQRVASMQVNRQPVSQASAGDSIGLKVADRVREGDRVFRV